MPFDPAGFKMPANVTVLPPTEGGGGGPRVRVEIEIVDRRQQSPNRRRRYWIATIVSWVCLLLLLARAFGNELPQRAWWQDVYSYRDSAGIIWTFPKNQISGQGGGHGCTTVRDAAGIEHTDCW